MVSDRIKRTNRRAEIGQLRRERTRERIVAAAAKTIADHGEENVTIEDFIRAAGVARGTFYNYFETRDALIEALWSYVGRRPFARIQQACAAIGDPAERLATELRLVVRQASLDPTWGWLVFSMSGARTVNEDLLSYPAPLLREGLASARFDFRQLDSARDMVVEATRAALRARLERQATDAYVAETCRLVLRALGIADADALRLGATVLPQLDLAPDRWLNAAGRAGSAAAAA